MHGWGIHRDVQNVVRGPNGLDLIRMTITSVALLYITHKQLSIWKCKFCDEEWVVLLEPTTTSRPDKSPVPSTSKRRDGVHGIEAWYPMLPEGNGWPL